MSLLDWFKRSPAPDQVKENPVAPIVVMMYPPGQSIGSRKDFKAFAEDGYQRNNVVYRCVNEISNALADIPWYLLRRRRDGSIDEVDNHPLMNLINRPNPLQNRAQFIQQIGAHQQISGDAYVVSVGPDDPRRPPTELYSLRPDRMKVIPDPVHFVAGYEYSVGGQKIKFSRDQVLHLKLFNPMNDFYGLSPIQVAARSVDKANLADDWNLNLFQNAGAPSGFIKSQRALNDQQFERLKKEIQENMTGPENARKPFIGEELEWQEMGGNPRDLDWVQGQKMNASEIARTFNVPLELVGLIDATFENRREARRYLYGSVVLPLLRTSLIAGFNAWLTPKFGADLELDANTDGVEALAEDQEKLWDRVGKATFITENEKRGILGFEPVEGGDVILVSVGMIPLPEAASGIPQSEFENNLGGGGKSIALEILNGCPCHGTEVFESVEGKAFSKSDRRRYQRLFSEIARRRDRFIRKLEKRLRVVFRTEAHQLAQAYEAGGRDKLNSVLSERSKEIWTPLLERHYLEVMRKFGASALDQLKLFHPEVEAKAGEFDLAQDLFVQIALRFARENAGKSITKITDTTRNEINRLIEAGLDEGLGTLEIAKQISDGLEAITEKRAESIARTETHNAQNTAQIEQVRTLNRDDLQKAWFWSGVSRTEHAAIDGVWVGVNDKFNVGGTLMDRPGDPAGGPENVINCTCTLIFRSDRRDHGNQAV